MHHPSWLFPGTCNNNLHRQDSAFHDIPANVNNKNSGPTGFEITSFVRSLNRNGIQLPESLILKSTGLSEDNNNNKCDKRADDKVRKSINDFLSILNESVDHVVGIPSRDRSNSSSFESFRLVKEDRDAAAWNDLIQLVSTTAHEFRDITKTRNGTECDRSGGSAGTANSGQRRTLEPNHSRWRSEKFWHDQELGRAPRSNSKSWRDYGKDCGNLKSSGGTTTRKIDLDVTPTNDDSRAPEVVQTCSEICGPDAKRGEDSLPEIGNFETPRRLVNEVLQGNSRDRDPPVWVSCNRRINLEDSLWPAGFTITSNGDFPPYFTGGPNKAFNFRSNFNVNSTRFMNVSRSSPIFVDAGEAIAEPPTETFARDHEMADRFSAHPDEGHPIDCRPTKLDKTVASLENADSRSSRSYKPPMDIETKPSPRVSKEKKKASESCRNEQPDTKRSRGRAKLVVKRGRKIRKQFSKRNNQEILSETEEEEFSDQDSKSIDKSPRSAMQRFFEESCQVRKEDETIGSARNEDFVESRMRTVSTIRSPANNHFVRKQVRPIAKPSTNDRCNRCNHVIAADRSKKDFLRIIDRPSSTSSRNAVTPKWLNIKCVCDKPGRKPDRNVRVTSSPSIPGNLGQSRVPQPPERIAIAGPAKNHGVPTVSSARLQNSLTRGAFETRKLQRPSTANEASLNRVSEAQTQGRSLKPVNPRGSSKDRKKSVNNDRTTGVNRETTIPVLRSKTFVHQIRRESSVRCTALKKDCSTLEGELASSKCMLNSATSGPMKQLYRKPWQNLSRAQRDADLSSETNLDDTPMDSRVNTDIELSRSVSAVSNLNSKKLTCRVEFKSKDSMIRDKEPDKVVNASNESRMAKNIFENKHARSLRMLKSILSHQGVNVEGVNKDAKEIRSRISKEPRKKSQMPICTGRKRSSSLAESENNSPKTSRTLFEKLAILTEAQPEKLARSVISKDSSERCSSFMNLGNDSMTSCAKSTKDAADQCSMDYASTVSINSKNDPQVRGNSMDGHAPAICVDASVSPLFSMTDLSRMESIKSFEVAATQTHCEVVDKESITDKRYHPVMNVWTETETATHEVSIDCSKASKDIGCGKDFSDVQSISREVNTETPEVFVKSRGVCFRGARKVDESSEAIPAARNYRDAASGRDYIEPGVSELVNTDRQDYLYVDRSVDVLGPKTTEDACQFEPQLAIVDVAVGDCYHGPAKLSPGFSRITISKDLMVSSPTSFTNFDLPEHNYAASGASTSSLVPWRGNSAEQFSNSISHVPKEAITALGMVLERSKNLYKAMEIHRENLAARKIKLGQDSEDLHFCRTDGGAKETNKELDNPPGLQDEIADIMSNLLSDATGEVLDQENVGQNPLDQELNLIEKNQGNPKIIEILDDVSEAGEEICQPTQKSWQFSLLSRNSLLTVVYGTVCSFVFWALQFSITCDSP